MSTRNVQMRWDTLLTGDSQSRLCKFALMTQRERKMYADGYNMQSDEYFFERPIWEASFLYDYYLFGECRITAIKLRVDVLTHVETFLQALTTLAK